METTGQSYNIYHCKSTDFSESIINLHAELQYVKSSSSLDQGSHLANSGIEDLKTFAPNFDHMHQVFIRFNEFVHFCEIVPHLRFVFFIFRVAFFSKVCRIFTFSFSLDTVVAY